METTTTIVGCTVCGVRARAHDRMPVAIRDLACLGRPARLVWNKRRWRCADIGCSAKTWTETSEQFSNRALLTVRAGVEACRQVGQNARPVSQLADEVGVCWWTVTEAVVEHGTPLVEDPNRVGPVTDLDVDETSFLATNRRHATVYATGLVDLDRRIMIDMVEGNAATDLRRWLDDQDPAWLADISTVATDLAESFRAGMAGAGSITPPVWPIRSMSCGSPTGASTRSAGGCRTRRSATAAIKATRSIGSASCCWPASNGSTNEAMSGSCWACASAIPTTNC